MQRHFAWWGGSKHRIYTIIVFIVLASLDNAARGVFPPLYAVIGRSLEVTDAALGFVSATSILVVAITAVLWGYWGDQGSRKRLLLYGTLIWSTAMWLTSNAQTYGQLLFFQLLTAIGIGCISSVGFSVITDLISPARRGLMLSLWGLSQGVAGGGGGALLGSTLGASNWRLPFATIAGAGFLFAFLYSFTYEPKRGQSEPELAPLFDEGDTYSHRIQLEDLRQILSIRTNLWLLLQSFIVTIALGSLIWMPRLYIARIEAAGHTLETATVAGNLLSLLLQIGVYSAVLGGYLGDRWQQQNPKARSIFSTISSLSAIPFMIALFFIPLTHISLPASGQLLIVLATFGSFVTNASFALSFLIALIGFSLMSLDGPNRAALLSDMNLPEHRSTIAGLGVLVAGIGLAIGNLLTGVALTWLSTRFPPPMNYAAGMAIFHLFLIPAGLCYYQTIRTSPDDIARTREKLAKRVGRTLSDG